MTAEILSVGTELLMGQVLNTNAQFLSRRLSALGVALYHQTTVGDNPARLRAAYETALNRADIVITSGGLGPTGDDITKKVLADLLEENLILNPQAAAHVEGYFKRLNRPVTENNFSQAMFTRASKILDNPNGTAPGAIVPCEKFGVGKVVIHLPGPPYEFEPMFDSSVAPYLQKRSGQTLVSRYIRIFGMGESRVDMLLRDLMESPSPSLSPYCSIGEVQLRATVLCKTPEEGAAQLNPLIELIKARLGDVIYAIAETDSGSLAKTVVEFLAAKNLSVCTCESLTGGLAASEIVNIPGASKVFKGGLVTYHDEEKHRLAGVKKETLKNHGAVSAECAMEMAQGAREKCGADIAVSFTGCAGPDSDERGTPVGLTFIGIATPEGATAHEFKFSGSRQRNRTLACLNGLNQIRLYLERRP
jgi:competence/damage-inducible protein CinA C-terminal domain